MIFAVDTVGGNLDGVFVYDCRNRAVGDTRLMYGVILKAEITLSGVASVQISKSTGFCP